MVAKKTTKPKRPPVKAQKKEGRRLPIEIKEARGTVNKTRESRRNEVRWPAMKELPMAPETLLEDGKREWYRVVSEKYKIGLINPVFLATLEMYCISYDRSLSANRHIQQHGDMIKTKTGWKTNPANKIFKESVDLMVKIAAQHGITPVSKTRVNADIEGKDPKKKGTKAVQLRRPKV